MSQIRDFYANQTVFLTGATGFLGKLTLEKISRTCPEIRKIYVLIRPRDKGLTQRLESIFASSCFDTLKSQNPDFRLKIHPLEGDCSQPQLGLNEKSLETLKNEVNTIIHSAANVRFDADLRTAVRTNVGAVKDILGVAKQVKNLKAVVYVSTAYSHCYRGAVGEEFYDGGGVERVMGVLEVLDDEMLGAVTKIILGKWPNTYCFTKALAEEIIHKNKDDLPIAIVRPSIVTSSRNEPIPGWIDNFHGIIGVVLGVALGVLRTMHVDGHSKAALVPADYVVNLVLAAAWDTKEKAKIYNITPDWSNTITWGYMMDTMTSFRFKYPTSRAIWFPSLQITKYEVVHKVRQFFSHTLFAYIVDACLLVFGKRTLAVKKYAKINKLINLLSFFSTKSWRFDNKNVTELWERLGEADKKLFEFDTRKIEWKNYFENCIVGGRVLLLEDPMETVGAAKKKMYLLAVVHLLFFVLIFYYVFKAFLWIF